MTRSEHTDGPALHNRVSLHPQVATTIVDDRALVILADDGVVDELNPLGTRIWSLIDGTRTVGEIAGVIMAEYDVSPEVAMCDTAEFLQTLADAHAVVLSPMVTEGAVEDRQ